MMAPEAPMPATLGWLEQVRADAPPEPGDQVEREEAGLAQQHLDGRADDEQGDHVEEDVQEVGVQPHGREGPVVLVLAGARPPATWRSGRRRSASLPKPLEEEHHHVDRDDDEDDRRGIGRADHAGPARAGVGEGRDLARALGALGGARRALPADGRRHHAVGADGAVAVGAEHRRRPVRVAVAGRRRRRLGLGAAHRMPASSSDRTRSATCSGSFRSQRPGELM